MKTGLTSVQAARLQDYFCSSLPEVGRIEMTSVLAGGHSSPVIAVIASGGHYVLRARPLDADPRQHRIDREYRVQKALLASPVPVARVLHHCSDVEVIGSEFYLMRHVAGHVTPTAECPGYSVMQRRHIWLSLVRTLASLHGVDWRALNLAGFGKPKTYLLRQIDIWSSQLAVMDTGDLTEIAAIEGWLRRNLPATEQAAIVHGDYRVGNVVLDGPDPRIAALLDWELSTIGDPLVDLAYLCMPYSLPADSPAAAGGLLGRDLDALGIPHESEILAEYARLTGWNDIDLTFYRGLAFYRTIAVMRGVRQRAERDPAKAGFAKDYDLRSRRLAVLTWEYLSKL